MTALTKFQARNAELIDILDTLTSFDWALKFASPYMMAADIVDADRTRFQDSVKMRSKSKTPVFNGLFVMAITNFELFVKEEIDDSLGRKAVAIKNFAALDKTFQNNYISSVGKVIAGASSGTVGGIPFTRFDEIVSSFTKSYVGDGALRLLGDVFTLQMGNPTWDRLTNLFTTLGITDPLGKDLAKTSTMKAYYSNAKQANIIKDTKSFHEGALRKRNSIVHSIFPIALQDDEVREFIKFYDAFAAGINAVISAHL